MAAVDLSACMANNLRRAARVISQRYDAALRGSGVGVAQLSILARLAAVPEGLPLGQLAEHLALERTTLTRNLEPLKRAGWVGVAPGRDRRTRLVRLTPNGRRTLSAAEVLWRQIHERLERQFGARRWRQLRSELQALTLASP